jgi:multiple sugar transport system permease protein
MKRRISPAVWFVAPATIHLFIFAMVPLAFGIALAFFKWNLIGAPPSFVGLKNFQLTFGDSAFWKSLWNSFRYAFVSVPLGMAVGLLVALLVSQKLPGTSIFRTIFYIPSVSSGVALAMLWTYVYLPKTGLINSIFGLLHLDSSTDFLKNEATAMWALVFMSIWTGLGPRMVLYLAGLLAIPPSLYEAASLDGANANRQFWKITLPMLLPTSFFVLVTSTIGALQVFTPVYVMTQGGPNESTEVVGYHIYSEAWMKFLVGLASAKSVVLLVVIILISAVQMKLMRSRLEEYSAGV